MLYTVALNTSVVLSCEMAAHPGDSITFSWSGNTSLISRHLDTLATSRTSQTPSQSHVSCQTQRFCQSPDSPHTKVEDNRDWCEGNNREGGPVTISMPPCPHSLAKTMLTDCD